MIPERLQQVLNHKGWSQSQLATEIHTHAATVNRWLRGKIPPSGKALTRVADATGCNLEWLLTGQGEMFPATEPKGEAPWYPYATRKEEIEAEVEEREMDEWLEEKEREKEIAELLTRASTVLNFQFKHHTRCYSDSLAATINALYRAVRLEEKFIPKKGLMALLERAEKGQAKNK